MMLSPVFVMESTKGYGWKVVWCEEDRPKGDILRNWKVIADGLTWEEANRLAKTYRVECLEVGCE